MLPIPPKTRSLYYAQGQIEKPTIETFTRLIEKKREGNEYTDEEIRSIVDAILDEEMPEHQQLHVMTTFFRVCQPRKLPTLPKRWCSREVIEMMDVSSQNWEIFHWGCRRQNHFFLDPLLPLQVYAYDERRWWRTSHFHYRKLKAIPKVNTDIDLDDFTDQVRKLAVLSPSVMMKSHLLSLFFTIFEEKSVRFLLFHLSRPVHQP